MTPPTTSAAERARWLAQMAEAIDEAQRLLWPLLDGDPAHFEALDTFARLEAARLEVASLRFVLAPDRRIKPRPHWMDWRVAGPAADAL